MAKLTINEVEADLVFDMTSWEEMEETVCTLDEMDEVMTGNKRLKHYREVVEIFSKEGERLGRGESMTADWLRDNLRPAQVGLVIAAIKQAIAEGMRIETASGENTVIDPVLAELEKKEKKDG